MAGLKKTLGQVACMLFIDLPMIAALGLVTGVRVYQRVAPSAPGTDGYGFKLLFAFALAALAGCVATAIASVWFGLVDDVIELAVPEQIHWGRRAVVLAGIAVLFVAGR